MHLLLLEEFKNFSQVILKYTIIMSPRVGVGVPQNNKDSAWKKVSSAASDFLTEYLLYILPPSCHCRLSCKKPVADPEVAACHFAHECSEGGEVSQPFTLTDAGGGNASPSSTLDFPHFVGARDTVKARLPPPHLPS